MQNILGFCDVDEQGYKYNLESLKIKYIWIDMLSKWKKSYDLTFIQVWIKELLRWAVNNEEDLTL